MPVILFGLLVLGWFYWFQWRPAQIRKDCYENTFSRVSQWTKSNNEGNKEWAEYKVWRPDPKLGSYSYDANWGWWYDIPSKQDLESWFIQCLNNKGLSEPFH